MTDYVSRQYLLDEYDRQHKGPPGGARKIIKEAPSEDVVPIKWIQKKIDKSIGMEHAMWSKLLRMWENEQLRKYVRNLKDDNK